MATTLPDDASKANCDSSADDPKQALLVDLAGLVDKFNALLDALGDAARLNLNHQFGTVSQSSGTPNDLRLKAPYTSKSANYTAVATDIGKVIDFTTGGTTLSFAAAATLGPDWWCEVRNSSTGTVTLDPDGSEQIDGVTTKTLRPGAAGKVVCTGSAFKLLGGAGGGVLQVQYQQTGTPATGTGTIPRDDTVPQSTEGTQFMSKSITPISATSLLKIDVTFVGTASGDNVLIVALFKSGTAGALACASTDLYDVENGAYTVHFTHFMTAGETSEITFTVRAGISGGTGTTYFNQDPDGNDYGQRFASSIVITEIAA